MRSWRPVRRAGARGRVIWGLVLIDALVYALRVRWSRRRLFLWRMFRTHLGDTSHPATSPTNRLRLVASHPPDLALLTPLPRSLMKLSQPPILF